MGSMKVLPQVVALHLVHIIRVVCVSVCALSETLAQSDLNPRQLLGINSLKCHLQLIQSHKLAITLSRPRLY